MIFTFHYSKEILNNLKFMANVSTNTSKQELLITSNKEKNQVRFEIRRNKETEEDFGFVMFMATNDISSTNNESQCLVHAKEFYNLVNTVKSDFVFTTALDGGNIKTVSANPIELGFDYKFVENQKNYDDLDINDINSIIDNNYMLLHNKVFKLALKKTNVFVKNLIITDALSYLRMYINDRKQLVIYGLNGVQLGYFKDVSPTRNKNMLPSEGVYIHKFLLKPLSVWLNIRDAVTLSYNDNYVFITQRSCTLIIPRGKELTNFDDAMVSILNKEAPETTSSLLFDKKDTNEILLGMKRLKNELVRLDSMTKDKLNIESESGKDKGCVNVEKSINISKMDKTAIDLKYLLEGLGTIDTDKVILNWINNLAPIFMREDKFDFYDYVYVFMPIKEA